MKGERRQAKEEGECFSLRSESSLKRRMAEGVKGR